MSERTLLGIWEQGQDRHPIDRSLLLCAWARPDLPPDCHGQRPLGRVHGDLLRLRARLFGPELLLHAPCCHCQETLEFPLQIDALPHPPEPGAPTAPMLGSDRAGAGPDAGSGPAGGSAPLPSGAEEPAWIDAAGVRVRLPTSVDLAAVVGEADAPTAALRLLRRCCQSADTAPPADDHLLALVEPLLEAADPLADLNLAVRCAACGGSTELSIDPGALLWDDLQAHGRRLLSEIHTLAMAYGWNEAEVLALPPWRRRAYLGLIDGGGASGGAGR